MDSIVERLIIQHERGLFCLPASHRFVNYGQAAARIAQLEADKARLVEVVRDIAHDKLCTGALHRPSICEKSWRARNLLNELGAE